jgi:hypothetical protein
MAKKRLGYEDTRRRIRGTRCEPRRSVSIKQREYSRQQSPAAKTRPQSDKGG